MVKKYTEKDEKPIPQVAGMFRGLSSPPFIMSIIQKLMDARGQRHLAYMLQFMGPRSTEKYWELVEARTEYRANFHHLLDEGGFDAIICPPVALPALTHGSSEHLFPALSYAFMYNVIGAPAGVVAVTRVRPGEESDRVVSKDMADITAQAVERGSTGLPVGVQVVARHWQEDIVLAVMAAIEDVVKKKPDYPKTPTMC